MTQTLADGDEIEELCADLAALSNHHRMRLVHLLTEPRYREEIGELLDMSRQAAAKHIKKLEDRGYVQEMQGWRKSGPVTEYQVAPQRLFALGMRIADLGRLEPEGGAQAQNSQRTMVLEDDQSAPDTASCPGTVAHLMMVAGPEPGTRFELAGEAPRWTIGRDPDRDLQLDHDPFISGHHAEIQLEPDGHALVDVYSANGTQLNFATLPEGGRAPLSPGDVITVGRTSLVYQARRTR